jgi:DNA-binding transcriptional regulator YbjK
VLRRDGVLALNHRAVAAEADVPLGSVTYHYRTLDDVLAAALESISDDELQVLNDWQENWDLERDLMASLVALLTLYCNDRRAMSILEYEVHVLAYRRPIMREPSRRWDRALHEILNRYMSSADADLVIAMMDGVMLNNLTDDDPLTAEWAEFCLAKVMPVHAASSKSDNICDRGFPCRA